MEPTQQSVVRELERRLGRVHARQRLGLEFEHQQRVFARRTNFFHVENLRRLQPLMTLVIKAVGLYGRGRRNAARVEVRHNTVELAHLPTPFDGFTILQLSDMHVDFNPGASARVIELLDGPLTYDVCVLTGDYRGDTVGPFEPTLHGLAEIRPHIRGQAYAVLGNHDTILMVPGMEALDIRVLLNEGATLTRDGARIHLVGIDDAHYFCAHNFHKAAVELAEGEVSVLLSHTPEVYREAAHAGFDVLLSGHTHGGQICLPGGVPVMLDAVLPRAFGAGAWSYGRMAGYTSVGMGTSLLPVRFNCPPEITLHHLRRA